MASPSITLKKFAQKFEDNEINGEILLKLTQDKLSSLGMKIGEIVEFLEITRSMVKKQLKLFCNNFLEWIVYVPSNIISTNSFNRDQIIN